MSEAQREFEHALAGFESDPRERWNRTVKEICRCRLEDVREDIAEELRRSYLRPLAARLKECFESGRIGDGERSISEFATGLLNAVSMERQSGRLKPHTPDTEVARVADPLRAHGYYDPERGSIRGMLEPGERILQVKFWEIVTDRRTIGRGEIREYDRPITFVNIAAWLSQFTSDARVRELEAAEAKRVEKANRRTSGPRPFGNGPW